MELDWWFRIKGTVITNIYWQVALVTLYAGGIVVINKVLEIPLRFPMSLIQVSPLLYSRCRWTIILKLLFTNYFYLSNIFRFVTGYRRRCWSSVGLPYKQRIWQVWWIIIQNLILMHIVSTCLNNFSRRHINSLHLYFRLQVPSLHVHDFSELQSKYYSQKNKYGSGSVSMDWSLGRFRRSKILFASFELQNLYNTFLFHRYWEGRKLWVSIQYSIHPQFLFLQ